MNSRKRIRDIRQRLTTAGKLANLDYFPNLERVLNFEAEAAGLPDGPPVLGKVCIKDKNGA
ncbi:MAG: hypothetical protein ABR605_08075 [Desulfurivibrionaceae bacterium]